MATEVRWIGVGRSNNPDPIAAAREGVAGALTINGFHNQTLVVLAVA